MAESAIGGSTLLVIEDDPTVRRILRMAFSQAGFAVDEVDTGTAALARLEEGGVSGVLLDLGLPDQRSGEVLAWLHAHQDTPPWLVLSAMDRSDVTRFDRSIDDRFIAKPFDPWVLIARVKAMTGRNGGG